MNSLGSVATHLAMTPFLLIAAGKRADQRFDGRRAYLQTGDAVRRQFLLPIQIEDTALDDIVDHRGRDVLADAAIREHALCGAVFGEQGDARLLGAVRRSDAHRLTFKDDLAAVWQIESEQRERQLRSARAEQSGNAQYIAAAHFKRDVLIIALLGQALHLQYGLSSVNVRL